jgi:uncharacterized protein YbcI
MEFHAASPDRSSNRILADVTEALVHLHRHYYGKGPSQAKSHVIDHTIVCMLYGGFTPVEQTLIDSGEAAAVHRVRSAFQKIMESEFCGRVEELTGRKVLAYMSQVHTDPNIAAEIFVLEPNPQEKLIDHLEYSENDEIKSEVGK